MFPVSDTFKQAIRQTHKAVVRAEVWRGDVKVLSLEPLSGSVEIDGRRSVRRTCTVDVAAPEATIVLDRAFGTYARLVSPIEGSGPTASSIWADYESFGAAFSAYADLVSVYPVARVVDAGIVPSTAFDALSPVGNELRLWRGIETRSREVIPRTYAQLALGTGS